MVLIAITAALNVGIDALSGYIRSRLRLSIGAQQVSVDTADTR